MSAEGNRRFQVADWNINRVVTGNGPPLLLLHGLGMSLEWWRPAFAELRRRFRVCAIDLPGAGDTKGPITTARVACRDLVAGVINALNEGPALVVGHSLGGFVAANAAILGAPGMRAMLLVAPGGFGQVRHPLLRLLSFPVLGDAMIRGGNLGSRIFLRSVVFEPRSLPPEIWTLAEAPLARRKDFLRQVRMGMRWGRTTEAYRVEAAVPPSIPVQLIWGRHDPVHPVSNLDTAERLLGSRDGVVFERSGHLPQLEEAARFHETLDAFAARINDPP